MPKPPGNDLEDFLYRQEAGALAEVLLELARHHPPVLERLERMRLSDRPEQLAAEFKATLSGWRRSRRFYDYQEADARAAVFEDWLEQVARELQPSDPAAALALFETFIQADATWFEQADDSDGSIGQAVRSACRHWLQAAAHCPAPRGGWAQRLRKLYEADEYGAREALLSQADLLLDEAALRGLVASVDTKLVEILAAAGATGQPPMEVFRHSAALTLLSQALRDPEVQVRATLRHSPNPNHVQREAIVRAFFDADQPAGALAWLQEPWSQHDNTRETLLAQALERLGRFAESAPIRQRLFERIPSAFAFDQWIRHVPTVAHEDARAHARGIALAQSDVVAAATLLMHLGDAAAAENRLVADTARIDGRDYTSLVALSKALREQQCPRGETVIYRALLRSILERGQSPAYRHAARYWARLSDIANSGADLSPLEAPEVFVAGIRRTHGRKRAFWESVAAGA